MFDFIKSIPQTFYSQPFYANLIRRGKGIGAGFILLQAILALIALVLSIFWGSDSISISGSQKSVEAFFDHLPSITIKEQKLSIDRPSPYFVEVSKNDKTRGFIVFDTSPREKEATKIADEMKTKNMLMLVTSDFVAVPKTPSAASLKNSSIEFYDFTDFNESNKKSVAISHNDWVFFGENLFKWGIPAISVFVLIELFVVSLFGTFFKALFVKICTSFFKISPAIPATLDIPAAMRLCAAATIPVGVLRIILVPFHLPLPYSVGLFISLSFALFALVGANKEAKAEKES